MNSNLIPHIETRVAKINLCDAEVICFDDNGFYILKPLYPVSKTLFQCEVIREGVGTVST